ncbi:MAG TPA: (2Fe-2S)-binding protein [Thermomicrobiales bacterium]|nr:(2Fe-2S)-binding protein [Thermomicrobiales bacterium]
MVAEMTPVTQVQDTRQPIKATLQDVDAMLPYQSVRFHPETDLPSLTTLLGAGGAGVHTQLSNMSTYLGTDDGDILVSLGAMSFPHLVASVAMAAVFGAGRLPDASPETTCYAFAEYGYPTSIEFRSSGFLCLPDDPDAAHPDATVVPDRAALIDAMRDSITSHVEPVLGVFRSRKARVGLATLRRTARECCMSALTDVAAGLGRIDQLDADIAEVFQRGGSDNPLLLRTLPMLREYPTGSGVRKAGVEITTCCLRFRIPGRGTCPACPNQPAEEREARMAEAALLYG